MIVSARVAKDVDVFSGNLIIIVGMLPIMKKNYHIENFGKEMKVDIMKMELLVNII